MSTSYISQWLPRTGLLQDSEAKVVSAAAAQQESEHSLKLAIVSVCSSKRLPNQRDGSFILASCVCEWQKERHEDVWFCSLRSTSRSQRPCGFEINVYFTPTVTMLKNKNKKHIKTKEKNVCKSPERTRWN